MENFSEMDNHVQSIRNENKIVSATGKGKVAFVSAEDIAEVVVRCLTSEAGINMELVLLGPELLSFDDIAKMIGKKLEREIKHENVDEEEIAKGMIEGGLEEEYASILAELDGAIRNGDEERLGVGGDLDVVLERKGKSVGMWLDDAVEDGKLYLV